MEWQFRNDAPIYTQLISQITQGIVSGSFPAGGRLPPGRGPAPGGRGNPHPMHRALAELERGGLGDRQRAPGRILTEG